MAPHDGTLHKGPAQEEPPWPPPKPKLAASQTWTVLIDGTPTPVSAEAVEITPEALVFTIDKTIALSLPATGRVSEIVPPPEPPAEDAP